LDERTGGGDIDTQTSLGGVGESDGGINYYYPSSDDPQWRQKDEKIKVETLAKT
jgi:hypothetical protein